LEHPIRQNEISVEILKERYLVIPPKREKQAPSKRLFKGPGSTYTISNVPSNLQSFQNMTAYNEIWNK
jgi:hypothetical protein